MLDENPTATIDTACWRIGEAARRSGVSAANMRYYEKEGLLSPGAREDNRYRLYSEADVHRLRFIRLCRAMDMSLDEVRTLLALDNHPPRDPHAACHTLDEHIAHVRTRRQELQALEQSLRDLRKRCDGSDARCHVLDALHAQADAQVAEVPRGAAAKRHV
ncbi:MAG: Cd(II)/Pb(II)-responsive transcriptional regulator [Giesbergeria sp.]